MDPATPLASSRAPHFTPASTARTRTPLSTPTRLSGAEGSRESQYMLKIGLGKRLNGQQQQGLKLARGIDALASIGWTLLEFYEAFFGTQDAVVTGWRNSIIKAPRTGQTYWLARLLPVVCEQATRAGARDAVATAITDQAAALLSHEVGAKIEDPALQRTASGATRATLGDPFVVGELHELFGNTFPLLVALINKVMGAPNRYERKQAATLLDKGSEPALGKRKGEKMPWVRALAGLGFGCATDLTVALLTGSRRHYFNHPLHPKPRNQHLPLLPRHVPCRFAHTSTRL